ncbi:hypothetical protein lerEdw1_004546 [Lerista edwardsae]|nr:hypothetical protein lerEdw1_004546 [Lerista edwardsae]
MEFREADAPGKRAQDRRGGRLLFAGSPVNVLAAIMTDGERREPFQPLASDEVRVPIASGTTAGQAPQPGEEKDEDALSACKSIQDSLASAGSSTRDPAPNGDNQVPYPALATTGECAGNPEGHVNEVEVRRGGSLVGWDLAQSLMLEEVPWAAVSKLVSVRIRPCLVQLLEFLDLFGFAKP